MPETAAAEELEVIDDDVEDEPEEKTAPAKDDKEKADPPPKKSAAERELLKEVKELRAARAEADRNAQYWHGRATQPAEPAPRKEKEEDEKLDDDFVEVIASNDQKKIAKLLSKMGFVRKGEVDETVNKTRAQIENDNRLFADYPELRKQDSEFFKTTTKHYAELVADDPSLKTDPRAIRIAAKMAKNEEAAKETEEQRNQRVAAQDGRPGRRAAVSKTDSDELSPAQREIMTKLQDAGSTITDDDFRKRARMGIRMAGAATRRVNGD